MPKKRLWQFRIATWFWIVLVVATFFLGLNWGDTRGPLCQKLVSGVGSDSTVPLSVVIPAMGPAPVANDFARPTEISSDSDQPQFSFSIGISR